MPPGARAPLVRDTQAGPVPEPDKSAGVPLTCPASVLLPHGLRSQVAPSLQVQPQRL